MDVREGGWKGSTGKNAGEVRFYCVRVMLFGNQWIKESAAGQKKKGGENVEEDGRSKGLTRRIRREGLHRPVYRNKRKNKSAREKGGRVKTIIGKVQFL